MAKYGIEISDEVSVEIDMAPGAPRLAAVDLRFEVQTEEELAAAIKTLDEGNAFRLDPTSRLQVRYGLELSRDGESVGMATLEVWLGDGLVRAPQTERFPSVRKIMDERDAARAASRA